MHETQSNKVYLSECAAVGLHGRRKDPLMGQTQHGGQQSPGTGDSVLNVTVQVRVDEARVHGVGGEARARGLGAMSELVGEENVGKFALAVCSAVIDKSKTE